MMSMVCLVLYLSSCEVGLWVGGDKYVQWSCILSDSSNAAKSCIVETNLSICI